LIDRRANSAIGDCSAPTRGDPLSNPIGVKKQESNEAVLLSNIRTAASLPFSLIVKGHFECPISTANVVTIDKRGFRFHEK